MTAIQNPAAQLSVPARRKHNLDLALKLAEADFSSFLQSTNRHASRAGLSAPKTFRRANTAAPNSRLYTRS